MTDQARIFEQSEGDAYFRRNAPHIRPATKEDEVIRLIEFLGRRPKKVLEIGAANGYRLDYIAREWGSECWGIDVSQEALLDGHKQFPRVHLIRGVGHELPIAGEGFFDLVIVNFVFHWVGRLHLLRSVAEVDRVLCDGGVLALGDFYPDSPVKTLYHHLPDQEVWTYKQDYPALFLASRLYRLVALATGRFGAPGERLLVDAHERIETAILRKELTAGYGDGRRPAMPSGS